MGHPMPIDARLMTVAISAMILCACNGDTTEPIDTPEPSQLSVLDIESTLITDAPEGTELIPVVAFVQGTTYELVRAPFEGELPGALSLTLDSLSPRVISQRVQPHGEPLAALGMIATISREREAELAMRRWVNLDNHYEDHSDPTTRTLRASWCLPDGTDCYVEDYQCTEEAELATRNGTSTYEWQYARELFNVDTNSHLVVADGCTLVGAEGDARWREPVESYLAFADNHWLLHLTAHAPAGSVTSYLMGETDAIPAGYSVIALDRFEESAAQADAREACEQDARDEAAEQVGSAHRVTLSAADFDLETCTQGISICDEAMTLALRARANLNCPFAGYAPRRVAETDLATLELTFGNDPVFPW